MEVCCFSAMTGSIGPFVAIRSGGRGGGRGASGCPAVERSGLASITGALLVQRRPHRPLPLRGRAADWSTPEVAAVVLDSQPQARRLSYKQVRDRYDGPLVMLLDRRAPARPPSRRGPPLPAPARSRAPTVQAAGHCRTGPSWGRSRAQSSPPGRASPPPSSCQGRRGRLLTGSTAARPLAGGPCPGRPRTSPSWACCCFRPQRPGPPAPGAPLRRRVAGAAEKRRPP
jgi:hypothetical protein